MPGPVVMKDESKGWHIGMSIWHQKAWSFGHALGSLGKG